MTVKDKSFKDLQESLENNAVITDGAKYDFLTFAQLIDKNYEATWFHQIIADLLEEAYEAIVNKIKLRIILSIPPRHGKSHTASILFPAWLLGKKPDSKIILSNYSSELSEKMGLLARDVMNSQEYSSIFPEIKIRKDVKAKRKWMTNKGGSFYGVGIGGSVTGTGAEVIIIDDPHKDRAEAESDVTRKSVWEYFQSTLYSRLEGPGVVIVIMQRWHADDLVGRLMEQQLQFEAEGKENYDKWRIINFPAIAEEDEYFEGRLVRKQGEALWPDKFPISVLDNIKTKSLYNWFSQYQQNPIATEFQEFKESYFRSYEQKDLLNKSLTYYTLCDPAISQDKDADNSVILTVAKDRFSENIYRIREDAGHYTPEKVIDLIFKHVNDYKSKKVALEQVAFQKMLKYSIEERQRKEETYFSILETKRGNKEERIRGLIPLYERGVIFHSPVADKEYEEELLQFPRGRRDDRADCMSFMLDIMDNTRRSKSAKQFKPRIRSYFSMDRGE